MSAIRSASSIAVTSTADRSHVRLLRVVGQPAGGRDQEVDAALQLGGLTVERQPADHGGDGQAQHAFAYGATASTTCWASSGSGPARGRGRRACERSPSRRDGSARPNASVFPEPVCARPSRSRPARVSGRVAAWIGNGVGRATSRERTRRRRGEAEVGEGWASRLPGRSTEPRPAWQGRGSRRRRRRIHEVGVCRRRGGAARRGVRRAQGTTSEGGRQEEPPGRGTSRAEATPRWRRLVVASDEPRHGRRPDWMVALLGDALMDGAGAPATTLPEP